MFTASELDSVRSLFAEKEKELVAAVAKVEELTHQLEELKKGNLNGLNGGYVHQTPAALQLDRLRQELLVSRWKDFYLKPCKTSIANLQRSHFIRRWLLHPSNSCQQIIDSTTCTGVGVGGLTNEEKCEGNFFLQIILSCLH